MLDPEGHTVTAMREVRGDKHNVRWRGRCSCGKQTNLHYSMPESAKTALRQTHIAELQLNEGTPV